MTRIDVRELTRNLQSTLHRVAEGEEVLVTDGGVAVAEIRRPSRARSRSEERRTGKRQLGLARNMVSIDERFFEPLPDELLDAFDGPSDLE